MEYPTWRYHATKPAVIVNDPAEDDALGEGWADSPAAFADDQPEAPKKRGRPRRTE